MIKLILISLFLLNSSLSYATTEAEKLTIIKTMIQKEDVDNVMEQFISFEQNQLPIKKDNLDTVTSVYYVKATKAKIYKHVLTPGWPKIISDMSKVSEQDAKNFMPELMQQQSTDSICSNKLNRIYLEHGVKIINIYSEVNGTIIFETTVTRADCGA